MGTSGKPGPPTGRGPGPEDLTPGTTSLARVPAPGVRAALALEEAGELEEAARVFEYAGEYSQAAALRLEHANTLRDADVRLSVLREACARIAGDSPEARALHRAHARAVLEHARASSGSTALALKREAAAAALAAGDEAEAGELFESLGELDQAARAYERAGAIERLELVLEIMDRRAAAARDFEQTLARADEQIRTGERERALVMLEELSLQRRRDAAALARVRAPLSFLRERALPPRRGLLELRVDDAVVLIVMRPAVRIGRAPDAEVSLPDPALSREHASVSVDASGRCLCVMDLGSRAGTFVDGAPLDPGEPERMFEPFSLALGTAPALHVSPISRDEQVIGARIDGEHTLVLLPRGGEVSLPVPVEVSAGERFFRLTMPADASTTLRGVQLGPGASVEVLAGDSLVLRRGATASRIEVGS